MPNNKPKHNPDPPNGGMYFEPLKPGMPAPVDNTQPRTFTDKNLDPQMQPGDPNQKITSENAKPGGSISPELNAPKQFSRGAGSTKPNPEGVTKI